MVAENAFPRYIHRAAEIRIREQMELVRENGQSRVVLLRGPGGVGKTSMIRAVAVASFNDPPTYWVRPIDCDDSEYWLLANLERVVVAQLDPDQRYFGPYLDYLAKLPRYSAPRVDHETVVGHLTRIKRVFFECYSGFIDSVGSTVVITFDSVEAIRGTYHLVTLTQWMKALPGTLFVLAGRSAPDPDMQDPILAELGDPYQYLPVTTVNVGAFTREEALDYLNASPVAAGLTGDEKTVLVLLSRGHPLWLAFAVDYLDKYGLPDEMDTPLTLVEEQIPFGTQMSAAGHRWHEEFIRRLVAPYRESDFWHEAIKRLAIVRERVNRSIWRQLVADLRPDHGADPEETWEQLLYTPWIETRANGRYATLHDAVAEELAHRVIPLHDQDQQWRRGLWHRAVTTYRDLIASREAGLLAPLGTLEDQLETLRNGPPRGSDPDGNGVSPADESTLIAEIAQLDVARRETSQLEASRLYYELICDFIQGCEYFLVTFDRGREWNDIPLQELFAFEMRRFLPTGPATPTTEDAVGQVIEEFRQWITTAGREYYLQIGLELAEFFIRNEEPVTTISLLDALPAEDANDLHRYRLFTLRGNASMRIPGRFKEARMPFNQALQIAYNVQESNRGTLIAAAHEQLGFYFRNEGQWREADLAYKHAYDAIMHQMDVQPPPAERARMASIQTNWAYVKGLVGSYREGVNLVESAISVWRRLNNQQEEGISWRVCGEVYRYERRFEKAWGAYARAEQIFQAQRSWPWLGLVYQEQAICLLQAVQDGITLATGRDPLDEAKRLITLALDLCRDLAVRGYPSALNRAGRIFGHDDVDRGLDYLAEGIKQARLLSDGWFWFANLIEYAELSYHAWARTQDRTYRDRIDSLAEEIEVVTADYEFSDLRGRWQLLNGHFGIQDWQATGDQARLDDALQAYIAGFALIARAYVGSSGAAAVPEKFAVFRTLFELLPHEVRTKWHQELRRAWIDEQDGSTLLLARLEELY